MTFAEFHNALRIMASIDMHELVEAGVIVHGDVNAWGTFRRDPFRFFIRAADDDAQRIYAIIKRRAK